MGDNHKVRRKHLAFLKSLATSKIFKYPIVWKYKTIYVKSHLETETMQTFSSVKDVIAEINYLEHYIKGDRQCFLCNKFFRGRQGRYLPMDKRERNDNAWGDTYVCFSCVPKEYGRL
jgi:hypothetical protein